MTVSFQNDGLIDLRAVTTFGVSSKDKDDSIGQFGTGLKYAIAILLRSNCNITIYRGLDPYAFGSIQETIRNDEFTRVTMNGDALGFTTHLGHHWELWQAYRELYCNTLDEGGETVETRLKPVEGKTTIVVEGQAFRDVHHDRSSFILQPNLISKCEDCEIHHGPSQYLFYQGVRVAKLPQPSLHKYNVTKPLTLTEDRTLSDLSSARFAACTAIVESSHSGTIELALKASREHFEGHFGYHFGDPSVQFRDVLNRLISERDRNLNREALKILNLDETCLLPKEQAALDGVDANRLDKAVTFCKSIGFPVSDYPIVVADTLGSHVLGRAAEGTIYISRLAFEKGTKTLAGTLLEEFVHLRHKVYDETREMQDILIDTMMSLGERATGELL